jgi:uncharacterized membrane protein (UPF0136 family)
VWRGGECWLKAELTGVARADGGLVTGLVRARALTALSPSRVTRARLPSPMNLTVLGPESCAQNVAAMRSAQ